jgi:uncharacterized DUF497 family protein
MVKPLLLTAHAEIRLRTRKIRPEWIEATSRDPDWTEPDPNDARLERRFRRIDEFGGRILRVVCDETGDAIRVISVMLDRNARRKP